MHCATTDHDIFISIDVYTPQKEVVIILDRSDSDKNDKKLCVHSFCDAY